MGSTNSTELILRKDNINHISLVVTPGVSQKFYLQTLASLLNANLRIIVKFRHVKKL